MNNKLRTALIGTALVITALGSTTTYAQQAGTTTVAAEYKELLEGWSVKKQFIGATVYNQDKAKVGKITDVIVAPDGNVSYAIVGAGGFVGVGVHNVAIPIGKLQTADDKLILPGATKDMIKGLPPFKYLPKMDRHL
jgi:sporulation protein YlmC with PRC-barrel domain